MALFTRSSEHLVAYLDESMENQPMPVTSVARYLFEPEPYIAFRARTDSLLEPLGIEYFRMTECNSASGQFAGKTDAECLAVEIAMIRLIRDHAILGVTASTSEATWLLMSPIGYNDRPYNPLCQWCMWEVGKWADRNNFHGDVAYFFESGHAEEKWTSKNLDKIQGEPVFQKPCRYRSHTFIDKKKERGLQAADLLAWCQRREGKYQERIRAGGKEEIRRKDCQSLFGFTEEGLKVIEHRNKHLGVDEIKAHFADNTFPQTRWYI